MTCRGRLCCTLHLHVVVRRCCLAAVQNNDVKGKPRVWKPLYDVVGIVFTVVSMNYLVSPFVVRCP